MKSTSTVFLNKHLTAPLAVGYIIRSQWIQTVATKICDDYEQVIAALVLRNSQEIDRAYRPSLILTVTIRYHVKLNLLLPMFPVNIFRYIYMLRQLKKNCANLFCALCLSNINRFQ